MFERLIKPTFSNSFFLFGARGTGKTTFLKESLLQSKNVLYVNLLKTSEEEEFLRSPELLSRRIDGYKGDLDWVVIDEVQRVPRLLDIAHHEIEERKIRFVLTGSSARKLKRGAANLLAGRAFLYHLFPLTQRELKEDFDLDSILRWGSLPKLFSIDSEEEKQIYLETYAHTYLREEVITEQLVRKIPPFRLFLEIAAQQNGKVLNFSSIAKELHVNSETVKGYFEILADTLIGFSLPSFHRSLRKQQIQSPKFYLFDLGVKRALERMLNLPLRQRTSVYGDAFEHFLITEVFRLNEYGRKNYKLSFLRTKDDAEIDLILDRPGMPLALIEIKSTESVSEKDTTTLERFARDLKNSEAFVFSRDSKPKRFGRVHALPWEKGLIEIGL